MSHLASSFFLSLTRFPVIWFHYQKYGVFVYKKLGSYVREEARTNANSKGDFQSIAGIPAIPRSGVNTVVLTLKLTYISDDPCVRGSNPTVGRGCRSFG